MKPIEMTIKFSSEREAMDVLGYLQEMIRIDGKVLAADLWGAMEIYRFGEKDNTIGWTALSKADVINRDSVVYLKLPMPEAI